MIRAILIDFGNTLVKQRTNEGKLIQLGMANLANYLKLKGCRLTADELEHVANEIRCEANRFREKTLIEISAVDRMAALLNRFGIPASSDDPLVWESCRILYRPLVEDMILFQDSLNFLSALKQEGYKLALVSNAASDRAIREASDRLGVTKFFDVMIISSQVGLRKPSSAVFMEALKALDVKPSAAVFIGDSIKNDVKGAKKLSIKTILVSRGSARVKANDSDAVVKTLADVVSILHNWEKPKITKNG